MANSTNDSDSNSGLIQNIIANLLNFGVTDYVVFILMLAISTAIGVYFGFVAKSQTSTEEYLFGGRKMSVLPIAVSLVASQLSAMSITSISAEVYAFGITGVIGLLTLLPSTFIMTRLFLPILYENNLSSCYQYLNLRFGQLTFQLVTASFVLSTVLFLPIFLFVPSLSFSQVTGLDVHLINGIVCLICVFYTMVGGVKAVVWTDVIQGGIMLIALIIVCIYGATTVGGLNKIFENVKAGGRLHVGFALDPRIRTTVWNNIIPGIVSWCGLVFLNQISVQRMVALPTLQQARKALHLSTAGCFVLLALTNFLGIIMFARYYGCDPIKLGAVSRPDKMISYFVKDVMGHMPGMLGLFMSCIFSAGLSSVSAILNSLSGILYLDYVKPFVKHSELKANRIMKLLVVVLGIYAVVGGYVVQRFSSILQIVLTVGGLNMGGLVGVFLAGIFMPRVNGRVASVAFVASIGLMAALIFINRQRFIDGTIRYDPLPTTVDNCAAHNITTIVEALSATIVEENSSSVTTAFSSNREFSIFEISFFWFKLVGVFVFFIVAIPLSFVWQRDKSEAQNPLLYSPLLRKRLEAEKNLPEISAEEQPLTALTTANLNNYTEH